MGVAPAISDTSKLLEYNKNLTHRTLIKVGHRGSLAGETIAVVGVTGQQGGAVMRALLAKAPGCRIRGITRDASTARAQAAIAVLGARGALVEADLDKVESLTLMFKGCSAVFGVTNFWNSRTMGAGGTVNMDAKKETAQGKNIGDAAKAAGVDHLIFSSLEDCRKSAGTQRIPRLDHLGRAQLDGEYLVPHFEGKSDAEEYLKTLGVPLTVLWTPAFMSNYESINKPIRVPCACGGSDRYIFSDATGSERPMPLIDVADLGKAVAELFLRGPPKKVRGPIAIAAEMMTGPEVANTFASALGVRAVYCPVPPWLFRRLPFQAARELGNMMQWLRETPDFADHRDVVVTRALVPDYTNLKAYFQAQRALFLPPKSLSNAPAKDGSTAKKSARVAFES